MAFHIGHTAAVAGVSQKGALAESVASRLNGSVPASEPSHEVEAVLSEVLAQSRRRAELDAFFRSVHEKALGIARKSLEREEDAQDALGDAYAKILAGKSEPRHFFRVLRLTILDRLRSNYRDGALFIRPADGGARAPSMSEIGWSPDVFEAPAAETRSLRLEDRDPLDILLQQAEVDEAVAEVQSDHRRRGVKSRDWWKQLVAARESRPESAGSNE